MKHPDKGAEISDSHKGFDDAGYILTANDLVVDIDCLDKSKIQKLITMFNIKTHTVWTDRGVHFYFDKGNFSRGANRICCLGFPIEFKHSKNTKAITVKRNGEMREVQNEGIRQELPVIFSLNKKFDTLLDMDESEGRNNALFKLRTQLASVDIWQTILRYVNNEVFAVPLDEDEFQTISRDITITPDKDAEPHIAGHLMKKYKIIKYEDNLFFHYKDRYISDNDKLIRLVFDYVGDQKTRYVDEIMKQIDSRCPIKQDGKGFDIKLNNGILRRGEFIEIDYDDFTPYVINIDYDSDTEPVKEVDDYINHLTQGEEDYKKIIFEILAHCLIVDPDFKRLLAKFFIFVGGGGNGKGTMLQIIKTILGNSNCTGMSIKNMSDERYLVSMKGKLANLGDDIQDEPINNEQMKNLKNISTCDTIEARELYKQSATITLTTSLIFTSNHVLKSFEKGKAYKRRVMWLPMFTEVKDENKDRNFIAKLTSEKALEYWISQIIEAYFRLYNQEGFTTSRIVEQYNEKYHKENNTCTIFLDDFEADDIVDKKPKEVYDEYETWCEDNGYNTGSKKMLYEAIQTEYGLESKNKRVNGRTMRVFAYNE